MKMFYSLKYALDFGAENRYLQKKGERYGPNSFSARDITKIIVRLRVRPPPKKVKKRVFPQLQAHVKFFVLVI